MRRLVLIVAVVAAAIAAVTGVAPVAAADLSTLEITTSSTAGGNKPTATVHLAGNATANQVVELISSDTLAATVPPSVTVEAGRSSANFFVTTKAVTANKTVTVTATFAGISKTDTLTVTPPALSSITASPSTVASGQQARLTVSLNGDAPAGGTTVALASSNSAVVSVQATVTVTAGNRVANVFVTPTPVETATAVTLTATVGASSDTASLTVNPATVAGLTLTPNSVGGGGSVLGKVTLTAASPAGGTTVTLESNNAAASVPVSGNVVVASGATEATFPVTTTSVAASTVARITASHDGTSKSANLTIAPPGLDAVSVDPAVAVGGLEVDGTVTLTGPAPEGGLEVTLSDTSSSVEVPATWTVPEEETESVFPVTVAHAPADSSVTIRATYNNVTKSTILQIKRTLIATVAFDKASVKSGETSNLTVTLNGPAPAVGAKVDLTYPNRLTGPASVTIPAEETSITFAVTAGNVIAPTSQTVYAKYAGVTKLARIDVTPGTLAVASVTMGVDSTDGGSLVSGAVRLTKEAPNGGTLVTLTSSDPAVATVPAQVTVQAGNLTRNFSVTTKSVAATQTVTITGTFGSSSQSDTLTVTPPPLALANVTVEPAAVGGGGTANGKVTLTKAADQDVIVNLVSTKPAVATVSVGAVTVETGETEATFTVNTSRVTATTQVSIRASYDGVIRSAPLTVKKLALQSITVNPGTIAGGEQTTATVLLNGPAPAGGTPVKITYTQKLTGPAQAVVPEGATSTTIQVTAKSLAVTKVHTVTATLGRVVRNASVKVTPAAALTITDVQFFQNAVVGGRTMQGAVRLSKAAPAGGVVVNLSSDNAAARVPATVNVPAGSTLSQNFSVTTSAVATDQVAAIGASMTGSSDSSNLTVKAPVVSELTVPQTVEVGATGQATVTISSEAPAGGLTITLASANTDFATVPGTVTVDGGATTAVFDVTGVAAGTTNISATAPSGAAVSDSVEVVEPAAPAAAGAQSLAAGGDDQPAADGAKKRKKRNRNR
jgi:hypothetical protein